MVDGLTFWHGAQLAIDTTLVSPLHRDGSARARAANHNGAALVDSRRRKKGELIPNCQGREGGHAWWSSQPKAEAGGTKRRPPCQLWPRLKPLSRLSCCRAGSKRHTFANGVLCLLAVLVGPSPRPRDWHEVLRGARSAWGLV